MSDMSLGALIMPCNGPLVCANNEVVERVLALRITKSSCLIHLTRAQSYQHKIPENFQFFELKYLLV